MRTRAGKGGFTLVELLVVFAVLAVLATILFPVIYRHPGEKAPQTQCTSNIKQLALAVQMYSQDNGKQYPGIDGSGWVSKIAPYLGHSTEMFQCPSDANDGVVSYAMSGLLIREDGTGVMEAQVISPSEVGALCDATPSMPYPGSRVIGGGAQKPIANIAAEPETRHSRGLVVGFVDGHAKYFQGAIDKANEANGAIRALYHALPLGLIDNPVACVGPGSAIPGKDAIIVGGEYATRPFLMAAAKMYAGGYETEGFKGQGYTRDRPNTGWAWGTVSGAGGPVSPAVAYDALVFIVARGSKIPSLPSMSNSTYLVDTATVRSLFQTGYAQNTVQVHRLSTAYTATDIFARKILELPGYGKDTIEVSNDTEMVEKVSNDPYAIGYCSSAFADPDRVVVLAFKGLGTDGGDAFWPQASPKYRWVMLPRKDSTWPWKRSINVTTAKKPAAGELAVAHALRGGGLYKNLITGPLYTWGYWPGDY
jgi:prepilin-type N-terminal cleavage/methylation domain-containing protein/prepilin-type processing-associated H-X9-DG protein